MKRNITISIDDEIVNYLRISGENISGLINNILGNYIQTDKAPKKTKEDLSKAFTELSLKEIELQSEKNRLIKEQELLSVEESEKYKLQEMEKESKEQMERNKKIDDHYQKIRDFFDTWTDEDKAEYLEGLKTEKWKNTPTYARFKLNLENEV